MSSKIFHSPSLFSLVEHLVKDFSSMSLFKRPLVIVQNRAMQEWLKTSVTDLLGYLPPMDFMLSEEALRFMLSDEEKNSSILYLDNLRYILFHKLRQISEEEDSDFILIRNYLKSDHSGNDSLKLYQLADAVAGLFFQYGMNFPDLINRWETSEEICNKDELWQRKLWHLLFQEHDEYRHLSLMLRDLEKNKRTCHVSYGRIYIFGAYFLGQTALEFFDYLGQSESIEIVQYLLSPLKKLDDEHPESTLLLELWGRQICGASGVISRGEGKYIEYLASSFPNQESTLTILKKQLQGDSETVDKLDNSFEIISTTDRWREVESIKNRIVDYLENNLETPLNKIGILAPDINEYKAPLESVFSREPVLPFSIFHQALSENQPFLDLFLQLIALTDSRFTRSDVFRLIANPCFLSPVSFSEPDYDEWLAQADNMDIFWGINEVQKKNLHQGRACNNTWQHSADRAFLGAALSQDDSGYQAASGMTPHKLNSFSPLFMIVENLYSELVLPVRDKNRRTMVEWVFFIERIAESWIKARTDEDKVAYLSIKNSFKELQILEKDHADENSLNLLSYEEFTLFLKSYLTGIGQTKGRYGSYGISCSSLKPLRAIPFDILFIAGLNEKEFPSFEKPLNFDLRQYQDQLGIREEIDLSRRATDETAFIEAILSTRNKLILSYQGTNPVSGEKLPPSPLIEDLLGQLGENAGTCVTEEALLSYDPRYFIKNGCCFSCDTEAFKAAGFLLAEKPAAEKKILNVNIQEESLNWTHKKIIQFFNKPQKVFVQRNLSVFNEAGVPLEENCDERWEIPYFTQMEFFRMHLYSDVLKTDGEAFYKQTIRQGLISDSPEMPSGREQLTLRYANFSKAFDQTHEILLEKNAVPVRWQLIDFFPSGESERGQLYFPEITHICKDNSLLKIQGNGPDFFRADDGCYFLHWNDDREKLSFKNKMKYWLAWLFLSQSGEKGPFKVVYGPVSTKKLPEPHTLIWPETDISVESAALSLKALLEILERISTSYYPLNISFLDKISDKLCDNLTWIEMVELSSEINDFNRNNSKERDVNWWKDSFDFDISWQQLFRDFLSVFIQENTK